MALIPRKRMSSDLLDPEPMEGSFNGVTSDGVFKGTSKAIGNILDDGSASETVVVTVPVSQSSDYTVGNYYEVQGKVTKLRTKTDGDNVTRLTFDTVSGVLAAINGSTGKIAVFEVSPGEGKPYPTFNAINSEVLAGKIVVLRRVNYDGRSDSPADYYYLHDYRSAPNAHSYSFSNGSSIKTVTSSNEWTTTDVKFGMASGGNKTEADLISGDLGDMLVVDGVNTLTTIALTTVSALTISCSTDIPNFALEIDNTGNANDVTLSVQNRNAALKPSTAGGTTVGAGKYVQLTCVGNCWTLAEFEIPTP